MPTIPRSPAARRFAAPLPAIADLKDIVGLLLAPIFAPRKGIRPLGVALSSLEARASAAQPELRLAL
jgi:DNA polymerase-4